MIGKLPESGNETSINWIFTSKGNNENIHVKVDLLKFTPNIKDTIYRKKLIFLFAIGRCYLNFYHLFIFINR
jgi:hypothetical protein